MGQFLPSPEQLPKVELDVFGISPSICYIELCVIKSVVYLDVNLITILKKMYHLHQLQYKNNA